MWVQFYVVLLEIPIQLICAQDLCDANQLEQKACSESRRAAQHSFAEAELPKSKSPPSGTIQTEGVSPVKLAFARCAENKFPTQDSKIRDGSTKHSSILPAWQPQPQRLPTVHTEMNWGQTFHKVSQVTMSLLGHNCPGRGRRAPFGRSCLPAYSLNSTCLSCSHTSEGEKEKLSEKAHSPQPGSPQAQAASAFALHSQPLSNPGNALTGKTRQPKGG